MSELTVDLTQRRLVERLSGWRLVTFFVMAGLNIGLLGVLVWLPWMFEAREMFVVVGLVAGAHSVFLITVSGFRFPISLKIVLGMAHAIASVWSLGSVGGMPMVSDFEGVEVSSLYLIPMLTMAITGGGVVVSRLTGFYRGLNPSLTDILLVSTALAILIPVIQSVVPDAYFTRSVTIASIRAAVPYALISSGWCLVVANLYLNFLPGAAHGKTPFQILIALFLLCAIISWKHCQFGMVVGSWVAISMLPVVGCGRPDSSGRGSVTEDDGSP